MTDKEPKPIYFSLQPSEMAIFRASAEIFAGYVATGNVTDENRSDFHLQAIRDAIRIAQIVENSIESDDEMRGLRG